MRTALSVVLLLPWALDAHHSRIEFADGAVHEIQGEVLSVFWRNPHAHFTVRADGGGVVWDVESADVVTLTRRGVPADAVQVGDRVRVAGLRSARRDTILDATNLLVPDGTEIVFRPGTAPRWSDAAIGAVDGEAAAAPADAGAPGLFRVWTRTATNLPALDELPLTPAALAAHRAFDPLADDTILACSAPGMPRSMTFAGPHPIEFFEAEGAIVLRMEYFNSVRTIHMAAAAGADAPATPMGHSAGRWEGDTLVVTTTRVSWPYFDLNAPLLGFPQSEAVRIVERFKLRDGGRELGYDLQVTDPGTFTEPLALTDYLIWRAEPGMAREPYDCIVNSDLRAQ